MELLIHCYFQLIIAMANRYFFFFALRRKLGNLRGLLFHDEVFFFPAKSSVSGSLIVLLYRSTDGIFSIPDLDERLPPCTIGFRPSICSLVRLFPRLNIIDSLIVPKYTSFHYSIVRNHFYKFGLNCLPVML